MKQANISKVSAKERRLGWVCGASVIVGLVLMSPVSAQQAATPASKSKSASSGSENSASAESSISNAVAALESGKAELASQQLSTIISGGKITTAQMARSLYYRGMAYRKMNRPAQAIADFTSALWIKNGLETAQHNDALAQRAGAYRDAGLNDQAEADEKRVAASAKSGGSSVSRAASAEVAPSASSQSAAAESGSGIGNFFGSLFGGGSSSSTQTAAAAAEPAPSSVGAWSTSASEGSQSARQSGGATRASNAASSAAAVSSWTTGSTVTAGSAGATPQKAAVRTAAVSPAGGSYVQVAAVRSREQARSVASRVERMDASGLKGRTAIVDEAVMGNMGTLYSVRVGPFANAAEVNRACPELRKAGLDCMIVDR
jgi:hypothetical protein